MKRILSSILMFFCCILTLESVLARAPDCQSGAGSEGYNAGVDIQSGIIDGLWDDFENECQYVDQFINAITDGISYSTSSFSGSYLNCRNMGMSDTLYRKARHIQGLCAKDCTYSGSGIGKNGAKMLCNLKVQYLQYAEQSLSLCDNATKQGCETGFRSFVIQNCSSLLDTDKFYQHLDRTCGNLI